MKLSAPIHVLKQQAKALKKERSIQLAEALNLIAQREGYNSWSLLQSKSDDFLPRTYEEVLGYLNPGDLMLIGGRPSMGKTSFAVGLFTQAINQDGPKHFLFTLDLVHKEIARRIAAYDETIGENPTKFELDYSDEISSKYIIEKTSNTLSKGSLIIVDYLQLLDQKRSHPPLQEQVEQLKDFAREKGCIIVFLSQLSRKMESRPDKRPTLSDIKLVNPLDTKLFNKIVLLFKDAKNLSKVTVDFHRPKRHSLELKWDSDRYRFLN